MPEEFLVQLYEQNGDEVRYNGMLFEGADMGGIPLSTRDFGSRDLEKHQSFDVERRYFMPDMTKDRPSTVNLVVRVATSAMQSGDSLRVVRALHKQVVLGTRDRGGFGRPFCLRSLKEFTRRTAG